MIRHTMTALAAAALAIPVAANATQVEITSEGPVIELSVYESVSAEPDLVTTSVRSHDLHQHIFQFDAHGESKPNIHEQHSKLHARV